MKTLRTITFVCFCAGVALITGCANIQPRIDAFEQQSKRLGVIYAQVNKVQTSEEWGYCDSSRAPIQTKNFACKPNMSVVQVSWVSKGMKTYPMLEAIPQIESASLRPGAIVALDMKKPYGQRYISLTSPDETNGCRWDGKKNALLESTAYKAAITGPAFLAGALMPIPAVAYIVSTRNDLGGVVCNGWTYQEAYKDKDIDSLLDIF